MSDDAAGNASPFRKWRARSINMVELFQDASPDERKLFTRALVDPATALVAADLCESKGALNEAMWFRWCHGEVGNDVLEQMEIPND